MILSILIISIIFNVYALYKVNDYKYKLEKKSYTYIEEIRQRNESNMEILSKSLKNNTIKNEELLKLYKNYDVIANDIMGLWQQYAVYNGNNLNSFIRKKSINSNKAIENDVHGYIEEYILCNLNNEMKNERNKLSIDDEYYVCFKSMYEMSEELDDYFNEFNTNRLHGTSGEERERIIIKNHYWVDMLRGIYDIGDNYMNVQWKIEIKE